MTTLNSKQAEFLEIISKNKSLTKIFYLTGGTALAEFYLKHRYSEDLDFFSEKEFEIELLTIFIKTIKKQMRYKNFEYQQSFNRNMYFLNFKRSNQLKVEFTYFPFPRIEKGTESGNLQIDSKLDIALNKLFSICQKPRARDFIDLFFLIQEENYDFQKLIADSQAKFDWYIDKLSLGVQLNFCTEVKDYPRMIKKIRNQEWQKFFLNLAKSFKKDIIKY